MEEGMSKAQKRHRLSLEEDLLNAARNGEDQKLFLAVAVLSTSPTEYRFVYPCNEYGDGDGERYIREFVQEAIDDGLLHPGETLETVLYEVKEMTRCTFSFEDEQRTKV
jgi:hypothetical protein